MTRVNEEHDEHISEAARSRAERRLGLRSPRLRRALHRAVPPLAAVGPLSWELFCERPDLVYLLLALAALVIPATWPRTGPRSEQ